MSAMRSASEQLARSSACDVAGRQDSRDGADVGVPSVEALATLLWATLVFEREYQRRRDAKTCSLGAEGISTRDWETGRPLGDVGFGYGRFDRAYGQRAEK